MAGPPALTSGSEARSGLVLEELFSRVSKTYKRRPNHIDLQDTFVETMQVVSAVSGLKPSFIEVFQRPERREHFLALSNMCSAAEVACGFGDMVITHSYWPLVFRQDDVAHAMMQKSKADRAPIFWISSRPDLAAAYQAADIAALDDTVRLGVPRFCAT